MNKRIYGLLENLEKLLQLHQEVSIIYVVDSYEAIFYKNDHWDILAKAKGNTLIEALFNLDKALEAIDKTVP